MFLFSPETSNLAINIKKPKVKNMQNGNRNLLYGCESWNTNLSNVHKLRVF